MFMRRMCNPFQVSYSSIKAETGWTPPEAFLRRRRVIVKNPAIDLSTPSNSSAEKSISLEQPPSSGNNALHSGKAALGNGAIVQRKISITYDNHDGRNVTSQLQRSVCERNAGEVSSPVKSPVIYHVFQVDAHHVRELPGHQTRCANLPSEC